MTVAPDAPHKVWRVGTLTYDRRGLVSLFSWLLWGDFAWSMRERSLPPTMQLLLRNFGASDTLNSVICGSLPTILGMAVGPIVSYKSDRHRGRRGRRIPFLLIPTPFIVLAIIGLAFSPALGTFVHKLLGPRSPGLNSLILILLAFFWTTFELVGAVSNSVYGALVNDVVPHPLLGRFYGLFRALSLIAGIIFYHWIFGGAETLYVWIILGMAMLYGVGFPLMCLNVKEGEYPPRPPMDEGRSIHGAYSATQTYFQECFGHSYYLVYFGATVIAGAAMLPFNLFSVFYAKSVGMSMIAYGNCLALTYIISLTLAYPIGWLADRFHPLRLTIAVLAVYSVAILGSYVLVRNAWTFSIALLVHGVIAGTFGTAGASIGQRLLPKAEFAQFSSAGGILSSLCAMSMAPAVGLFLDHAHHDYRYTFLMNFYLSIVAVAALMLLYTKFMALGGPDNFAPPEKWAKEPALT